jgi:hypothetical protein
LNSSKVQARVNEQMRKLGDPPPNAHLITRAVKQPASFALQVECTNLEYARQFATTWAREFLAFKTELRENAIGRTAASTRDDIIRYERNLEQARTALLDFQRKNNLGSAKETGDAAQQRLDKLEADYQDIKTLRQRLENKSAEQLASGSAWRKRPDAADAAHATRSPIPTSVDPLAPFEEASRYGELKLRLKTLESERVSAASDPQAQTSLRAQDRDRPPSTQAGTGLSNRIDRRKTVGSHPVAQRRRSELSPAH